MPCVGNNTHGDISTQEVELAGVPSVADVSAGPANGRVSAAYHSRTDMGRLLVMACWTTTPREA